MTKYVNVTLIKILASFYGIIVILGFTKRLYLKRFDTYFNLFYETFFDWLLVILFMILAVAIIKKMFEKKVKSIYIFFVHFFLSFTLGWVYIFFSSGLRSIFVWAKLINDNFRTNMTNIELYMNFIDLNFKTYFIMLGVIYVYYYIHKIKEAEIHRIQLENLLSSTRMKVLTSQLRPHFLFNTLHSIHSLLNKDTKLSQDIIVDFSNMLREIIDQNDEMLVELQSELLFLNKYLRIIKIRFSEDLKVELYKDPKIENVLVPNIFLQPIVENSIKHGYSKKHKELHVTINIFKSDENIIFVIKNNGKKLKNTSGNIIKKGTGINNILERLKILYRDDYKFDIYNSEFGVTTKITIPYKIAEFKPISKKNNDTNPQN